MSKKNKCENSCAKKTSIGGQALMEGIMMRGPQMTAMAVRNPQGEIVLEKWETEKNNRPKFFKLPIIRGCFNFFDSMKSGYKCLMRSAEISGLEEIEREAEEAKKAKKAAKKAKKKAKKGEPETPEAEVAEAITQKTEETGEEYVEADSDGSADTATEGEYSGAKKQEDKSTSLLMGSVMLVGTVLGVAIAVLLFIMLPSYIY